MRSGLLLICCGLAATVSLGAERKTMPPMRPVPPLPQIGLPLPPIGLPLPHIGLPPPDQPDQRRTAKPDRNGGRGHRRGVHGLPPAIIFLPAPYYVPVEGPAPADPAPAPEPAPLPAPAPGALVLDVQPAASMQVYVDGYYTGVTDVIGSVLDLEPGPHRIELRADGYDSLAFDVRIAPDEHVVYQGQLAKANAPADRPAAGAAAPAAAAKPMTLYVIPGCYAGNVPPDATTLAPGCDAGQLTTIER